MINNVKYNDLSYAELHKAIACINNNVDLSMVTFRCLMKNNEMYISSLCGLIYSCAKKREYDESKKWMDLLISCTPKYEPYIFPIDGMLRNNKKINEYKYLMKILQFINLWFKVDNNSNQANLYSMKLSLNNSIVTNISLDKFLMAVDEQASSFEKSYLLSKYYLKLDNLDESIRSSENVISYLTNNDTPIWAGQISSYEKRKNAGIIMAEMMENIAICYFKKGEYKTSRKYALICKKIKYSTLNIEKILSVATE